MLSNLYSRVANRIHYLLYHILALIQLELRFFGSIYLLLVV